MQDSNVAPPEAAPPAGPPLVLAPGAPPPVAGPVVMLRSDTYRARLQTQGPLQWRDVCAAPCRIAVDPAALYRIGGGTIRASDTFKMPRPSGSVIVDVRYGSTVKHWVGVALIIGGVLDAIGGIIFVTQADWFASRDPNNGTDYYKGAGIVSIVTGVILTGIGIPLSLSSTEIEVH